MPWTDASRRRCAIYTRKSSEEGLEQEFNSLAAQREACEAYIRSQQHEGWVLGRHRYDDGGFSGGNIERPALQRLLADIRAGRIDIVVVYKVDRLTRSLADFARLVELFDAEAVSFVSVTQQFNTTSSMGRLTLNVLLSFAQFELEVTGERIRDNIAASKKRACGWAATCPLRLAMTRTIAHSSSPQPRPRRCAGSSRSIVGSEIGNQTFDLVGRHRRWQLQHDRRIGGLGGPPDRRHAEQKQQRQGKRSCRHRRVFRLSCQDHQTTPVERGREGPESAHLARSRAPRRRSAD
jgi:predicted site-specific integrase-resolvase